MSNVEKSNQKLARLDEEIGYQFLPLVACPLPPRPPKRPNGQDWVKKIGDTTIRIVASSEYGIPYGRDILIVLYLIREMQKQGTATIKFNNLSQYLDTFKIDKGEKGYKEAKDRFRRIFYSTWFWTDEREGGPENTVSFRIIDAWNVYFNPDLQGNTLFENTIAINQRFSSIVARHPLPYVVDDVIKIKDKPAVLALYLWLVGRAWQNWHGKEGRVLIPFFGENGLQTQLSSEIDRTRDFRKKMQAWIEEIKEIWPECPVEFEKETDVNLTYKKAKPKKIKDALFIEVKNVNQLRVMPHFGKELRIAQEQAQATEQKAVAAAKVFCPHCKTELGRPREGKPDYRGRKLPDYYHCPRCFKNLYQRDYPELYKNIAK